jgi:hypothetical protein
MTMTAALREIGKLEAQYEKTEASIDKDCCWEK